MCTTLKDGKDYVRGGKDLGGKEENRGPGNLCVMRVYVGTMWEKGRHHRGGQRTVEDVKKRTKYRTSEYSSSLGSPKYVL